MKSFVHILKYKLLIFLRLNAKLDLQNIIKNIGSSIIYIGFSIGTFILTQKILWYFHAQIKIGLFLIHQFMSIILFIFFIAVNVGNIIVSYSTLYKSNEVSFLFTKPIEYTKIFTIKFLDNFFYSSSTLILIILSVLTGYAVYFKLDFVNLILLLFLNFLPLMFTAGSLGVIILLFIIKLATKFGFKKVIYSLGSVYVLFVISFFKINSPFQLIQSILKYYPIFDKDKYLSELIPSLIKLLPNNWLSESAFWLLKEDYEKALPLILLQLLLALAAFSIAVVLGRKWYYSTWLENIGLKNDFTKKGRMKFSFFSFENKYTFNAKTDSFIKRDLFMFFREPNQVIHFSVLLFLIIIFLSSVTNIHYVGVGNIYLQTGIFLAVILFNLLLISTLSLRFIFPLISLEGQAFWKVKSSPVEGRFIINKKLQTHGLIIMLIASSLSYFSFYKFNFLIELAVMIIIIFASFTIIAINLSMGGFFVNFKEKNAIRLSSSQGASITFLIILLFILFIVMLLFVPISNYFLALIFNRTFNYSILLFSLIPIILLSTVLIVYSIKYARKSLERDF